MTVDGRVKNNGKKTGRPQYFMHGLHERIKYAKKNPVHTVDFICRRISRLKIVCRLMRY